ncbi:hypothetical protein ACTMU2_17720 [Cupriavidus basilensis]
MAQLGHNGYDYSGSSSSHESPIWFVSAVRRFGNRASFGGRHFSGLISLEQLRDIPVAAKDIGLDTILLQIQPRL